MADSVRVTVPCSDRADLAELCEALNVHSDSIDEKYGFDGLAVLQLSIDATALAISTLGLWLAHRESKKSVTKVTIGDIAIKANSAKEMQEVLEAISRSSITGRKADPSSQD